MKTPSSSTAHYQLTAHGSLPWDSVRVLFEQRGQYECAWADLSGYHVGPLPAKAPPYSHLWAWEITEDGTFPWLARVRIDGSHGIVGILEAASPATTDDTCQVVLRTGVSWHGNERIPPWANVVPGRQVVLFQTVTALPVTYMALQKPASPDLENV